MSLRDAPGYAGIRRTTANRINDEVLAFRMPREGGGYRGSSRLGATEKWNSELLDENKALKLQIANPFANLPQEKNLRAVALDKIVERGARSYIELGRALSEMKNGGLYAILGYDTWEGYCIEKRNIAKSYAYYLVSAYEISTLVESKGMPLPPTETHARELSKLLNDPSKMLEAYSEFLELDETTRTASALRGIVQGYLPPKNVAVADMPSAHAPGPTDGRGIGAVAQGEWVSGQQIGPIPDTEKLTPRASDTTVVGPTNEVSGERAAAHVIEPFSHIDESHSLDSEGGDELASLPSDMRRSDMESSPQSPADFSSFPDASNWTIDTVRQYTSHVNSFIRESAKLASKHPDRRIWLVSAYNFLKQVMETENLL